MSLLSGYTGKAGYSGPDNKVQHQLEATRSVRTLILLGGFSFWYKESIKTESFSYTGMTEAAAATCAADMVTAYTKNKTIYTYSGGSLSSSTVSECVADIRAVHVAGLMWQVNVEVNEKDYTITAVES